MSRTIRMLIMMGLLGGVVILWMAFAALDVSLTGQMVGWVVYLGVAFMVAQSVKSRMRRG